MDIPSNVTFKPCEKISRLKDGDVLVLRTEGHGEIHACVRHTGKQNGFLIGPSEEALDDADVGIGCWYYDASDCREVARFFMWLALQLDQMESKP
jgi:hypothetical protein